MFPKSVYIQMPSKWVEIEPEIKLVIAPALVLIPVCSYFGITIEQLKYRTRKREIVYARQTAICMLRVFTSLSLKSVGEVFNFDHTTSIHSVNTIKDLCDTDKTIREEQETVRERVRRFIAEK
jgi:chromosomal replication initiation ATPase DnaA